MANKNEAPDPPTPPTSASSSFLNEVRSVLFKNTARTLASEAEALLHQTFAKEWEPLSVSVTVPGGGTTHHTSSTLLSPGIAGSGNNLRLARSPGIETGDFDFMAGENTLDWVSSLYNKLPSSEMTHEAEDLRLSDHQLLPNEVDFFGLGRMSMLDTGPEDLYVDEEELMEAGSAGRGDLVVLTCAQCGFVASNRKQLWRHGKRENHVTRSCAKRTPVIQRPRKDKIEHKCSYCDYVSKSRFNVLRHYQRVHINEKSAVCEQCGKQFKDLDTLKTHIKYTHTNLRQHQCPQCEKQFVSSSDLQRHRKIVHEKVRDFVCQKCGKRFQTSTNAKRHYLEVCAGLKGRGTDCAVEMGLRHSISLPSCVQLPTYEAE